MVFIYCLFSQWPPAGQICGHLDGVLGCLTVTVSERVCEMSGVDRLDALNDNFFCH